MLLCLFFLCLETFAIDYKLSFISKIIKMRCCMSVYLSISLSLNNTITINKINRFKLNFAQSWHIYPKLTWPNAYLIIFSISRW